MQRLVEQRPNLCFSLRGGAFTPNIYLIFPPMKEQKHLMQKSHCRPDLYGRRKEKKNTTILKPLGSYRYLWTYNFYGPVLNAFD